MSIFPSKPEYLTESSYEHILGLEKILNLYLETVTQNNDGAGIYVLRCMDWMSKIIPEINDRDKNDFLMEY